MKEIQLTQGKVALVSDEDYDALSRYVWRAYKDRNKWYAKTGKKNYVRMHNLILGIKGVDHIDGDGLNNQRFNLRPCTVEQNSYNRGIASHNTSGYKGVSWSKSNSKWLVHITANKKCRYLGYFDFLLDAAVAYDKAACELHGEFAKTNFLSPPVL